MAPATYSMRNLIKDTLQKHQPWRINMNESFFFQITVYLETQTLFSVYQTAFNTCAPHSEDYIPISDNLKPAVWVMGVYLLIQESDLDEQ